MSWKITDIIYNDSSDKIFIALNLHNIIWKNCIKSRLICSDSKKIDWRQNFQYFFVQNIFALFLIWFGKLYVKKS